MKVELLHLTPDALNFIGDCAGICYNAKRTLEANVKRAVSCVSKGHLATLRFAHATFHVSGISRACSHQFVRSKHLDFLQQSQRYVKQDDAEFVIPTTENHDQLMSYYYAYHYAHEMYKDLLARGVKKEDARLVLPEATSTELIVTGNLQAWMDFIALRDIPEAQWEIRGVAHTIKGILHSNLPEIFPL